MPQSLEDLVEQFMEEGYSKDEAVKLAKKRFLQETKVKSKPRIKLAETEGDRLDKIELQMEKRFNKIKKDLQNKQQNKNKNKINNKKIIRTKEGGKIGDKLVASFYGGCN